MLEAGSGARILGIAAQGVAVRILGHAAVDIAKVGIAHGEIGLDIDREQQFRFGALQVPALGIQQRQVVVRFGQLREVLGHGLQRRDGLVLAPGLGQGPCTLEARLGIARVGGQHAVETVDGLAILLLRCRLFGARHAGVGRAHAAGRAARHRER